MKTAKIFSLDMEIVLKMKTLNNNWSEIVNSYLKDYLDIPDDQGNKKIAQLKQEVSTQEVTLLKKKILLKEIEDKIERDKGDLIKIGNKR